MLSDFVKVAKLGDLQDNTMISVSVGREYILLAKVRGEVFAIDDCCTHMVGSLSMGTLLVDECEVECPLHEGCFSLRTGEATARPAEEPVVAYQVRIEGDDIFVGPKE